jgi:hypothetical protein
VLGIRLATFPAPAEPPPEPPVTVTALVPPLPPPYAATIIEPVFVNPT